MDSFILSSHHCSARNHRKRIWSTNCFMPIILLYKDVFYRCEISLRHFCFFVCIILLAYLQDFSVSLYIAINKGVTVNKVKGSCSGT